MDHLEAPRSKQVAENCKQLPYRTAVFETESPKCLDFSTRVCDKEQPFPSADF